MSIIKKHFFGEPAPRWTRYYRVVEDTKHYGVFVLEMALAFGDSLALRHTSVYWFIGNSGFYLQRAQTLKGGRDYRNPTWINTGTVLKEKQSIQLLAPAEVFEVVERYLLPYEMGLL